MRKNKIELRVSRKKKFLTIQQKESRLSFVNYMLDKINEKDIMRKIIFTDESGFTNENGRVNFYVDIAEDLPDCLFNFEGQNISRINFYAFLTYDHFEAIKISSNFDQNEFHDLLINKKYLDYMRSFIGSKEGFFIQDNSPVHEFPPETNKTVRSEVQKRNLEFLEFPVCSNDLNLIENLFKLVKEKLRSDINQRINQSESLEKKVIRISKSIDKKVIKNLFNSYFKRCRAVKKNNGGSTKY
jgi:hypothetical protein